MNIIDYINNFKDYSFEENKFNELDSIVFSSIIYLDFEEVYEKETTLEELSINYFKKIQSRIIKSKVESDNLDILNLIYNSNRYKNIIVKNYVKEVDLEGQFCACNFIGSNFKFICFEGTDETIVGWKEDFEMVYKYPISSQKKAINYLRKNVKLFDKNIIVGGHSKGGNLALVSSMNLGFIKRLKLLKIYNNDGPGLRLKELNSKKYKRIKKKHIHIIPDHSYIGVLNRNDEYKVIKTTSSGVLCHHMSTWLVENNRFIESELSQKSKNLISNFSNWLDNHDDVKREELIKRVFSILEELDITTTSDLKNIKNIIELIKKYKNLDNDTKKASISFLMCFINK